MKKSHVIVRSSLPLLLLFVAALGGASGQTSDTRSADEARIREASEEWGRAALNRDPDKAVSFYAEDASYLPPGAPIVVGKDDIRKAWANFLAIPGITLKTTTTKVDVARSGDLAYEIGTWDMTMNDKEGKPVNSGETGGSRVCSGNGERIGRHCRAYGSPPRLHEC